MAASLIVAQLELDVAHGAVDFGRGFVGGDGALQLFEGFVALAREVQGDGARQVTGTFIGGIGIRIPYRLEGTSHCCSAHWMECSSSA